MKKMNLICSCNNSNLGIGSSSTQQHSSARGDEAVSWSPPPPSPPPPSPSPPPPPPSPSPPPPPPSPPPPSPSPPHARPAAAKSAPTRMPSPLKLSAEREVYEFIKPDINPDIIEEFNKFSGEQLPITTIVHKSQLIVNKMKELISEGAGGGQGEFLNIIISKYASLITMVRSQTKELEKLLKKGNNSKITFKEPYKDNLEKLLKMINEYEILLNYINENLPDANRYFVTKILMDSIINESNVIITTIDKMVQFSLDNQVSIIEKVTNKLKEELHEKLDESGIARANAKYVTFLKEIMENFTSLKMFTSLNSINRKLNYTKEMLEYWVKIVDEEYATLKKLLENVLNKGKANITQEDEITRRFQLWMNKIMKLGENNIANIEIFELEKTLTAEALDYYFVTKLNELEKERLSKVMEGLKRELDDERVNQSKKGGNKKKYNTKKGKEKKYHTKKNKIKMKRKERKTKTKPKMKKHKRVTRRK